MTTFTTRGARQMALDLLMPLLIGMVASRRSDGSDDESISQIRAAIAALEAELAQAVDPVAWIDGDSIVSFGNMKYGFIDRRDRAIPDSWIPLYAAEPAVNAQPVEPVACAWAVRRNDGGLQLFFVEASARRESECGMWRNPVIPLYTTPPEPAVNAELLAALDKAKTSADGLRRAVAEIIHADPDTWPDHGNAPLAIAAVVGLRQAALEQWQCVPEKVSLAMVSAITGQTFFGCSDGDVAIWTGRAQSRWDEIRAAIAKAGGAA